MAFALPCSALRWLLVVAPLPARAASSVQIEARALVGGRYEVGGWMALSVTLVNEGEPTEGYVVAETVDRLRAPLRRDARRRAQGRDALRPARGLPA